MFKKIFSFLALLVAFLGIFFYLNLDKTAKISISGKWYNISQQKYLDEKNPKFNDGDLIERIIFAKNEGFFDVKNYLVKDYNPFTKEFLEFHLDIPGGGITKKTYKVIAKKIEKFDVILESKNAKIQKISSSPKIGKNKKIVPFWSISGALKKQINNDFDEYFEIYGKNLKAIDNILIDCGNNTEKFKILISDDGKASTMIKSGTLTAGKCKIGAIFNGITVFSEIEIDVKKSEKNLGVAVKNITPREVSVEKGGVLVFQGKGFEKVVAVQISNGSVLDLDFVKKINSNVLIVNIPKKMKKGEYFFRILTKNGIIELKEFNFFVK